MSVSANWTCDGCTEKVIVSPEVPPDKWWHAHPIQNLNDQYIQLCPLCIDKIKDGALLIKTEAKEAENG